MNFIHSGVKLNHFYSCSDSRIKLTLRAAIRKMAVDAEPSHEAQRKKTVNMTDWEIQNRKLQRPKEQKIHSGVNSDIRLPDHNE